MKVYITTDLEGVTGATHWDETDKKKSDYGEFQEQMTAEVVAACEGALSSGATEIWVRDAHWTGRNIIASKLPREARLVRGWSGHPFSMMQGLDETFQAVLVVGYHSRAGSGASPLAHTMTGNVIYVTINGQYASEFLIAAYTAGLVSVPVAFVSGDAGICQEAEALIPGLGTVAVKEGTGNSTVSIHPHLAVEQIRAGVEVALKGDLSQCHVTLPDHFAVELRHKNHSDAYRVSFFPEAGLKEAHIVQFEADDYFEVLRFFSFAFV